MAIIQGNAKGGASGFYPKELEQSLRFNDDDNAHLSWTPSVSGNRRTWTWSGWVKRGNLGSTQTFFEVGNASTYRTTVQFKAANDSLEFAYVSGGTVYVLQTSQVFRDPSAWYHIVLIADTSNATSTDRMQMYVNGERVTAFASSIYPALNATLSVNDTVSHNHGTLAWNSGVENFDGYLSEVHFVDGQALDATSFGEFKNGVWVPKDVSVTYGTNGFYLPFRNDYTVEGFSTVTYTGNGDTRYIGGVGFEPDLVWVKNRNGTDSHVLVDSVRGSQQNLFSNSTAAEATANRINSFSADGFEMDGAYDFDVNEAGSTYVAWCWDAGTGSPASNTDGSITSTVKANPAYGFSVVSWTGDSSANNQVGHGLSQEPDLVIMKNRDSAGSWWTLTNIIDGSMDYLRLNATDAKADESTATWTSTTFSNWGNAADSIIAYCFHSVSGYSDFGSYTGTGASGNTVTTGFKPAFVMTKRTDTTSHWIINDATRSTVEDNVKFLYANLSNAEDTGTIGGIEFTDTGFIVNDTWGDHNASGGTYIYMAFADTREAAFWLDDSGNNNDWENNNLTESDIVLDSPTNNFATLNPITNAFWYQSGGIAPLQEGNLLVGATASPEQRDAVGTIGVSSGKWYWELVVLTKSGSSAWSYGVVNADTGTKYLYYAYNGGKWITSLASYAATWDVNDVMGIVFDADAGIVTFYKNNVSQGVAFTGLSGTFLPLSMALGGSDYTVAHNFGQDSSFAGNKTPQGNTDANGLGDFYYAPPAGYLALCTSNLPEPAIGPNSATTSDEHFNTVLWTGNGSTQSITGVGFQPDWVWVKERSSTSEHAAFDVIRGVQKRLVPNSNAAEDTSANLLTAFNLDGFSVGSDGALNQSSQTYVAWNWKANGSGVSNTDGSITSTVSANTDAGFSIVTATLPTSGSCTIGHGLTQAPEIVISKTRDTVLGWTTYAEPVGVDKYLYLNTTAAPVTDTNVWDPMTSTTIGLAAGFANLGDIVFYAFHSVDGFSKFGSYTGNGSADGPMVFCGFRPSFVMIKRTDSAGSWEIYDNNRIGYNVDNNTLFADLSNAESTADRIDILSNGLKLRSTAGDNNASGGTYIYMAFAENPFKYSNAR